MVEVVLVQCNLENNQYQQKSEVFYTSRSKNSYTYLLNVKSSNLVFLKTYNTKFDKIIITFTDQNGRPVEIKDKVNLTFLINRDDALFYETKNKKIHQRIWIFVICKKSIQQLRKNNYWILLLKQYWMLWKLFQKIVYKTAEATGEFTENKVDEKTVKPKPIIGENSRNIEEIVIASKKRQKILIILKYWLVKTSIIIWNIMKCLSCCTIHLFYCLWQ